MLLYLTRMGDLLARNFKTIYCAIFRRKSKPKCQNRTSGKDSYDEVQVQCPLAEHVNRGKIYTTDDVIPSERCRTSECFQERPNVASIHRPVQCVRLQQLPTLNEETERTTFKRNGDIVIGERHGGGALPVRHDDDDEGFKSKVTVPVFISLFIVLTYFFSGAALFHYLEGWSYMDSVFFCFTSLTTIGFGFMHPGKEDQSKLSSEVRIILCYIYLTLGMAIIAMCFNLMQECVMKNKKPAGYPDVTHNVDAPETGERLHAEPHQPDIYC
ncbi:KCNK18 (predicted) [Pycnogonum litorale]